jgi:hypothetical protein
MKQTARNLTAAVMVMAVSAYWFVESDGFRQLSRLFPRFISAVVFVLAAVLAVLTLFGKGPVIRISEGDPESRHLRSGTLIAVMVVWTALIPLLGLLTASVLGVTAIGVLTFRAHIGTQRAILIAVAVVVAFYLLFAVALNVPFPRGILI